MKTYEAIDHNISLLKNKYLLLTGIMVPIIIAAFLQHAYADKLLILIAGAILAVSLILNFEAIYTLFIGCIFLPFSLSFHVSVLFSVIVALSFFINYTGFTKNDFRIPINKAIIIYLISILPSFYNSIDRLASFSKSFNLIGLFVIMYITAVSIRIPEKISNFINVFLLGVFVNTIYVIYLGMTTGQRVFGFSGIFYVDFVGLGSLLAAIIFIYSKGFKKLFIGIIFFSFVAGLILTQTRNAWLSFGLSFFLLILFLLAKHRRYFIPQKNIIYYSITIIIFIVSLYFGVSSFSSGVEGRLSENSQTAIITESTDTIGGNSFITRALIWHTAYNAFLKHPIVGIGVYSFPFSSYQYYTIPKDFFKVFVENKTPHVTFVAVITETGIIGMIGFLSFLFAVLKLVFKNLGAPQKPENVKLFLMINWTFIYIVISMFMTDAWLWGQQAMILGMFLGFLVVQNRINTGK